MKSRVGAQLEAEEIAMHEVRTRLESGSPATSTKKLQAAANQISNRKKKFQLYLEEAKQSSFCQWFLRVVERQNLTIQKTT